MRSYETINKLKYLYSGLKKTKISKTPQNSELDSLIDKINELDAYYAGLALTASEGGEVSFKSLYDIEQLIESLKQISMNYKDDTELLEECWSFLKILHQIDIILLTLATK